MDDFCCERDAQAIGFDKILSEAHKPISAFKKRTQPRHRSILNPVG
jgi:hypothetical protein